MCCGSLPFASFFALVRYFLRPTPTSSIQLDSSYPIQNHNHILMLPFGARLFVVPVLLFASFASCHPNPNPGFPKPDAQPQISSSFKIENKRFNRDYLFILVRAAIQDTNPCFNGEWKGEKCVCIRGWSGGKCSIHVHEVSKRSQRLLLQETQYFLLGENIKAIDVDWGNVRVFKVEISPTEHQEQIYQGDLEISTTRLYKVRGEVGDTVVFKENSIYLQNPLLVVVCLSPILAILVRHLLKKIRTQKGSSRRFRILSKMVCNDEECSICMMAEPVSEKVQLPCSHSFHKACLLDWIPLSSTCPNCRDPIDVQSPTP